MSRRYASCLAVLVVCLVAVAPIAGARIGNPMKKAKEKLQKAAGLESQGQTPEGDDVVFDNVVVELTNDRVTKIVAGFQKAHAEASARQELADQYNQKNDEMNQFVNKNQEALQSLRDKRGEVERCTNESYRKITERKAREIAENPMDPQRLAQQAKLAQENNAAAARGDSAAIARTQNALNVEVLPSKEDSAAVRKSCGTPPPKSAAELRMDAMQREMDALSEKMRAMDERMAKAQAKDVSLTQQQWSVALERVQMYDAATKGSQDSGGSGRKKKGEKTEAGSEAGNGGADKVEGGDAKVIYVKGCTKAELEVLAKHRAELRAALK